MVPALPSGSLVEVARDCFIMILPMAFGFEWYLTLGATTLARSTARTRIGATLDAARLANERLHEMAAAAERLEREATLAAVAQTPFRVQPPRLAHADQGGSPVRPLREEAGSKSTPAPDDGPNAIGLEGAGGGA